MDSNFLKGNRTKLTGWITAISSVGFLVGIDIDPETTIKFIQDFKVWLIGGYGLLGGLVHYFRDLANDSGGDDEKVD